MKTLAFLSQKGGSGKTTLAVHTAVAAQERGERVVVVDTDVQKSATTWKQAREGVWHFWQSWRSSDHSMIISC